MCYNLQNCLQIVLLLFVCLFITVYWLYLCINSWKSQLKCYCFVCGVCMHAECTRVCSLPSVTQDSSVVQRSSPVAIHLVDLGSVLQEELAGCQSVLPQIEPGNTWAHNFIYRVYLIQHITAQWLAVWFRRPYCSHSLDQWRAGFLRCVYPVDVGTMCQRIGHDGEALQCCRAVEQRPRVEAAQVLVSLLCIWRQQVVNQSGGIQAQ